jgi:hypothetical protein
VLSGIDEILAGYEGIGGTEVTGVARRRDRQRMVDAIGRIVRAECQASGSPKDPEFETIFTFPVTDNDAAATGRVAKALAWLAPH